MVVILGVLIGLIVGCILGLLSGMILAFYGVKKGWVEQDGYYYEERRINERRIN